MKKIALIAAVALALPLASFAQSAADAAKPPLKERAKNAAKNTTQKVVPKRVIKKPSRKPSPSAKRPTSCSAPEDLAVAKRVLTGTIKCELGASVTIEASQKKKGFFIRHARHDQVPHAPGQSRTGAIRLEDPRAGAMWLQLGNKSMLMSQKQGLRLADECQATAAGRSWRKT